MIIETIDLSIQYGDKTVVRDVNMHVNEGEFITIVGPNGCGKSTLLKGISRIIKPAKGQIKLWGVDIKSMQSKEIARRIAVLPQIRKTPSDFDVETLIRYGRYPHGNFMGRLGPEDRDNLSGGENQRAWIAMALAQKTSVIVLDEPTTFLDIAHQLEVLELLRELNEEEKVTIVLVLHDLNQAIRYSDRTYVMQSGEIATVGNPESVIESNTLSHVFDVDSDFYREKRYNNAYFIAHKSGEISD